MFLGLFVVGVEVDGLDLSSDVLIVEWWERLLRIVFAAVIGGGDDHGGKGFSLLNCCHVHLSLGELESFGESAEVEYGGPRREPGFGDVVDVGFPEWFLLVALGGVPDGPMVVFALPASGPGGV